MQEHKRIMELFDYITKYPKSKSNRKKVIELRGKISEHLVAENEILYPALCNSKHKEFQELGKSFYRLMIKLEKDVQKCLNKAIKNDGILTGKLLDQVKDFSFKIKNRLVIEDYTLIPAFEEFHQNTDD